MASFIHYHNPTEGIVNRAAYEAASRAARDWATRHGGSRIKASNAVADSVREAVAYSFDKRLFDVTARDRGANRAAVTKGLKGLQERLAPVRNRTGRGRRSSNLTYKGSMLDMYAGHYSNRRPLFDKLDPGSVR